MQPGVAGLFSTVWQQVVVGVPAVTAGDAATRRGADRIAVQPFDNAAFEGSRLGLRTRQSAIEFDNAGAFVKATCQSSADHPSPPGRSSATISALCWESASSTAAGGAEAASSPGRRHRVQFDAGGAGRLENLDRAQNRVLQPATILSADGAEGGKGVKGGDLTATTRHAVRPSASAC